MLSLDPDFVAGLCFASTRMMTNPLIVLLMCHVAHDFGSIVPESIGKFFVFLDPYPNMAPVKNRVQIKRM